MAKPASPERPISRVRRAFAAVALLATAGVVTGPGCSTDAVGVDECRQIEHARCEAASHCGIVDDVESCQRFYRDHCLHGLAVESPGAIVLESCVGVIQRAGECARDHGQEAPLEECGEVSDDVGDAEVACDLVLHPERSTECSFLWPSEPPPGSAGSGNAGSAGSGNAGSGSGEDGAGGSPGGGGASAGQTGSGGQAGSSG
jgi:uncharacterized membrane protein YgcG